MSNDIITTIYHTYIANAFEDIQASSTDSQVADANLEEFEKKHNISTEEQNDIEENIITEITYASKLKGFTDGFKLAVRLMSEIYGITK